MEVRVLTYVEKLDGTKILVNKAYLVFVAIDNNEKPIPVPPFVPLTDEEKKEWDGAVERKSIRLKSLK